MLACPVSVGALIIPIDVPRVGEAGVLVIVDPTWVTCPAEEYPFAVIVVPLVTTSIDAIVGCELLLLASKVVESVTTDPETELTTRICER